MQKTKTESAMFHVTRVTSLWLGLVVLSSGALVLAQNDGPGLIALLEQIAQALSAS